MLNLTGILIFIFVLISPWAVSVAFYWIEDFFKNIVREKNEISFFQYFGPLFFRYLGTEERLTICKMQKNYGLDSTNTNYLTSFKFEDKVLQELSANVKRIFKKDIILDTQTLGDRLGFRVGEDFGYLRGTFEQEKEGVLQLFIINFISNFQLSA